MSRPPTQSGRQRTDTLAAGAPGGQGIGGGVYNRGTLNLLGTDLIKHNFSTTSGDDVGP